MKIKTQKLLEREIDTVEAHKEDEIDVICEFKERAEGIMKGLKKDLEILTEYDSLPKSTKEFVEGKKTTLFSQDLHYIASLKSKIGKLYEMISTTEKYDTGRKRTEYVKRLGSQHGPTDLMCDGKRRPLFVDDGQIEVPIYEEREVKKPVYIEGTGISLVSEDLVSRCLSIEKEISKLKGYGEDKEGDKMEIYFVTGCEKRPKVYFTYGCLAKQKETVSKIIKKETDFLTDYITHMDKMKKLVDEGVYKDQESPMIIMQEEKGK